MGLLNAVPAAVVAARLTTACVPFLAATIPVCRIADLAIVPPRMLAASLPPPVNAVAAPVTAPKMPVPI